MVLWEASDRVCGKRLKALLPVLVPALERNGHLKGDAEIRLKVLSMSAATSDRLLRMPRSATHARKVPGAAPEQRRRIKMRTFADWNEPLKAPWKWTWWRITARSTAAAACTAWF